MKKLLSLLKATMSQDMSLFRIKAKNESSARKVVLPIVLALAVMFSIGSYAAILNEYAAIPCSEALQPLKDRVVEMSAKLEACTNAVKEARTKMIVLSFYFE